MKRDLQLVIKILEAFESESSFSHLDEEYGGLAIRQHMAIMEDAGLILRMKSSAPNLGVPAIPRMTWAGHDFLAATREPKVWNKLKDYGGRLTFEALMRAATELGVRAATGQLS